MKKLRVSMVFRALTLAAATMMVGLLAVGGAEAADNEDTQIQSVDPSAADKAQPLTQDPFCCQYGVVTCSTNGAQWEYYPPSSPCIVYTRVQALNYCNSACSGTCTDSGWLNGC